MRRLRCSGGDVALHWKTSPTHSLHPDFVSHHQGFVPRVAEDFGDGGAFPEIHVAQVLTSTNMRHNLGSSSWRVYNISSFVNTDISPCE